LNRILQTHGTAKDALKMIIKLHIVLTPGAWCTGGCYDVVVPHLEEAGYSSTALTQPGVGADLPGTSTDEDVAFTHSTVSSQTDSGKDVVVVMHS
jgi:hypothetical protein